MWGCDHDVPDPLYQSTGPELIEAAAESSAAGMSRRPTLWATFDRALLPITVHGGNIQLLSGASSIALDLEHGLLAPQITATLTSAQPLAPMTIYRLLIKDVWDLDRGQMQAPIEVAFRTEAVEPAPATPPDEVGWSDVSSIFSQQCAGAGCHQGPQPAMGLDLATAQGVRDTAVGRMSRQYYRSTAGSEGSAGLIRLTDLRIVDVLAGKGRPTRSYMMYKIVGDSHILGQRMPPRSADREPLSTLEQSTIQTWIFAGAPTE
jgi:hypothetical protein